MRQPREYDVNEQNPCYDCGSTITGHHTKSCALAYNDDVMDLPEVEGTQYWTESKSGKRRLTNSVS